MLVVFQLMTRLMRVKREMQASSVNPSCVSAPPFCVVRLVRLLVNWYNQSTPELVLGSACANKATETISSLPQFRLGDVLLPGLTFMGGGGIVLFLVRFHALPESLILGFAFFEI